MPRSNPELSHRTLRTQNVQLDLDTFVKDFSGWRAIDSLGKRDKYYQPCSADEYERRVEVIRSKVESGRAAEIGVSEFQDWVELDWMRPHGSFETGHTLGEKVGEEAQEYYDEITLMQSRARSREPNRDTHPGISEAGDYLWTLMAMSSNSGVDLEASLQAKFQTDKPITLGDLHEVTKHGFGWLPLRVENPTEVGAIDSDTGDLDPYIWLRIHPYELHRYMYHLYGKGEHAQKPSEAPNNVRLQAADWHADALLFLGYYVQHWTFSSLPEVGSINFEKITDRVKQGTVDKLNGAR